MAEIISCVLVLDKDSDFARIRPLAFTVSAESYNPFTSANIFSPVKASPDIACVFKAKVFNIE